MAAQLINPAPMSQERADPEVMDLDAALGRVEGDRELLAQMAVLFLEDYDLALEVIRTALARSDTHAAARGAHGLKGSLASLGAEEARKVAVQVEALAVRNECSRAREACDHLAEALARLRPVLEDVCRPSFG